MHSIDKRGVKRASCASSFNARDMLRRGGTRRPKKGGRRVGCAIAVGSGGVSCSRPRVLLCKPWCGRDVT